MQLYPGNRRPGAQGFLTRQALRGLALAGALTILVIFVAPRESGFPTAKDCLNAYYEATQAGDSARFLRCLIEPLRSDTRRQFASDADLAEGLRQKAVKNWVMDGPTAGPGDRIDITIDEVRTNGIQRVDFRLQRGARGWLIARIEPLGEKRPSIPYETDVRDIPDAAAKE